jgi:hypothetical protein
MELDGRFLGSDGKYITFLVMPGARTVKVPVLDEATGAWRTAAVGQSITISVSQDFCARSGLFDGAAGSRPALGGSGVIAG